MHFICTLYFYFKSRNILYTSNTLHIVLIYTSGAVVKNSPNSGDRRDRVSIPGLERSHGGGNSNPLQYSCLEDSMGRGAW